MRYSRERFLWLRFGIAAVVPFGVMVLRHGIDVLSNPAIPVFYVGLAIPAFVLWLAAFESAEWGLRRIGVDPTLPLGPVAAGGIAEIVVIAVCVAAQYVLTFQYMFDVPPSGFSFGDGQGKLIDKGRYTLRGLTQAVTGFAWTLTTILATAAFGLANCIAFAALGPRQHDSKTEA